MDAVYRNVAEKFEIPELARPYIDMFLRRGELALIEKMESRGYEETELLSLAADSPDPLSLIQDAYSRGVLNKLPKNGGKTAAYRLADFYTRLAFFAQYEPESWLAIPECEREKIDDWYVGQYIKKARPRLSNALSRGGLIENAFFFTLEETLELIDSLKSDPYVVPCNCKSVALRCRKKRDVCILFNKDINSEWDRGHGRPLSREEAKALVIEANRQGLMQTSETESGICNCCGDCCYPIRASKAVGAQGIWPKQRYAIIWDETKCVGCGRCAAVCNFSAFKKEGRKITFDEKACWGCTVCKNHCPVSAISIKKLSGAGSLCRAERDAAEKGESELC